MYIYIHLMYILYLYNVDCTFVRIVLNRVENKIKIMTRIHNLNNFFQ